MIKTTIKPPKNFLIKNCEKCGGAYGAESFAKTKSFFYPDGHLPICNDCLRGLLEEYEFIKIVGNNPECNYVGIVSCLIDGISSDSAGSIFDQQGIALRTGLHCAPLAHQFLGTYPAGTIRFSVSCFTTEKDFEDLREALDYIEENL